MAYLSKKDILGSKDYKTEVVSVPEWGGDVLIRELSGYDRDKYQLELVSIDAKGVPTPKFENIARAKLFLVALSIVDEQGNKLFTEEDIEALGAKSGDALDRVYVAASDLSKLNFSDKEQLKKS